MRENQPRGPISPKEMEQIRAEAIAFAGIGLYRYDLDGTILFIDAGALRILDLADRFPDPASAVGLKISDLIVYVEPPGRLRQEILSRGHARGYQYPFRTLSGKERWALHDSYLVADPATGAKAIQVIIRDITDLKKAEMALAVERERLAVTLRSIGDGVISTDRTGIVALMNREAERLTGWTQAEAVGRPLSDIFRIIHEFTRQPVRSPVDHVLEKGAVVGLANHTVLIARDGVERAIADSGAPILDAQSNVIGVVLVFRDVTEQRQIEMDRQRTDKLESIGLLAGGIAHDFNNYLTAILGNIAMARMSLAEKPGTAAVVDMLNEAEKASTRARALTQQLLTFSKGGAPVRQVLSLPDLLRETAEFALRGSAVELKLNFSPDLSCVEADPDQICQVIDNIIINAKQAMPQGGILEIAADNVEGVLQEQLRRPGRFVRIRLRDSGNGIPPENLGRIFDPYFSTKKEGSGLGLTTAFSIVRRHDGHIQVESRVGEGSVFTVFLPASDETPGAVRRGDGVPPPRGGAILVLDDKDFVLKICARQLAALGYQAVCVMTGEEAVKAYRDAMGSAMPFRAAILDLTIPGGMGGVKTLEQLKQIDPEVRAIASSGYSNDPVMSGWAQYGFRGAIRKPYDIDELGRVLGSALGVG